MPTQTRIVGPSRKAGMVQLPDGSLLPVPEGWALLPPGDATLTRRIKADGPSWTVQFKRGRKTFSQGVWAPADRIEALRAELLAERSTETYAKRRTADAARREKKQTEYVEDFRGAILEFLSFAPAHAELAGRLADAVAKHATPVGSGTVARTRMIPIEKRAELAVIAWLRHQTTAYDSLKIPRIRGKRKEVRRQLRSESRRLLARYRAGDTIGPACPLQAALTPERTVSPAPAGSPASRSPGD